MLCQMSKYFDKCFGPFTPAPESSFWLRCPSFLLSKFSSQLKLIQSVVPVRILGICFTSSNSGSCSQDSGILLSGFWQFAIPRYLFRGSWVSGSHVPESQFEGPGWQGRVSQDPSQNPRVTTPRVLGLRVLGSQVSGSQVPGLRFWF